MAGKATPAHIRFWQRVRFMPSGCWEYQGFRVRGGYTLISVNGRRTPSHRFAYEDAFGELPKHLVVMHTCDNPPCVRLAHLRPGTYTDNMADMRAKGRATWGLYQKAQTHCKNGHEFTPENLGKSSRQRVCRKCKNDWDRAYRAAIRLAHTRSGQ